MSQQLPPVKLSEYADLEQRSNIEFNHRARLVIQDKVYVAKASLLAIRSRKMEEEIVKKKDITLPDEFYNEDLMQECLTLVQGGGVTLSLSNIKFIFNFGAFLEIPDISILITNWIARHASYWEIWNTLLLMNDVSSPEIKGAIKWRSNCYIQESDRMFYRTYEQVFLIRRDPLEHELVIRHLICDIDPLYINHTIRFLWTVGHTINLTTEAFTRVLALIPEVLTIRNVAIDRDSFEGVLSVIINGLDTDLDYRYIDELTAAVNDVRFRPSFATLTRELVDFVVSEPSYVLDDFCVQAIGISSFIVVEIVMEWMRRNKYLPDIPTVLSRIHDTHPEFFCDVNNDLHTIHGIHLEDYDMSPRFQSRYNICWFNLFGHKTAVCKSKDDVRLFMTSIRPFSGKCMLHDANQNGACSNVFPGKDNLRGINREHWWLWYGNSETMELFSFVTGSSSRLCHIIQTSDVIYINTAYLANLRRVNIRIEDR